MVGALRLLLKPRMLITSIRAEFALKLPGFSLKVLGYLGGEDYLRSAATAPSSVPVHDCRSLQRQDADTLIRYVLKDKDTGEVLFVVVFTLLPKEQVGEEEANVKESGNPKLAESGGEAEKDFEPQADDLD